MKKFKDYNETQSYTESAKLPVGGYIVKVQNIRLEEGTNGNSDPVSYTHLSTFLEIILFMLLCFWM